VPRPTWAPPGARLLADVAAVNVFVSLGRISNWPNPGVLAHGCHGEGGHRDGSGDVPTCDRRVTEFDWTAELLARIGCMLTACETSGASCSASVKYF
jgi:hypothetical protein